MKNCLFFFVAPQEDNTHRQKESEKKNTKIHVERRRLLLFLFCFFSQGGDSDQFFRWRDHRVRLEFETQKTLVICSLSFFVVVCVFSCVFSEKRESSKKRECEKK